MNFFFRFVERNSITSLDDLKNSDILVNGTIDLTDKDVGTGEEYVPLSNLHVKNGVVLWTFKEKFNIFFTHLVVTRSYYVIKVQNSEP